MQESSYVGARMSKLSLLSWWSGVSRDTLRGIELTNLNKTLFKLFFPQKSVIPSLFDRLCQQSYYWKVH